MPGWLGVSELVSLLLGAAEYRLVTVLQLFVLSVGLRLDLRLQVCLQVRLDLCLGMCFEACLKVCLVTYWVCLEVCLVNYWLCQVLLAVRLRVQEMHWHLKVTRAGLC